MNKTVALQFLGAVGVSLAVLSTAATCSTAKTGQSNCGPDTKANCITHTSVPGEPANTTCVAASTQNNRMPGTCVGPNNQANPCDTTTGNVAVTYTAYKPMLNPCDCNLQVTVWTQSGTVDCPVTYQDANPDESCD